MFYNKKISEYSLKNTDNKFFSICSKKQSKFKINRLQFSYDDRTHFLVYGAILGSNEYKDYLFKFSEHKKNGVFFGIESKYRKSFLLKKNIKILSGYLFFEDSDFDDFFKFLIERASDNVLK